MNNYETILTFEEPTLTIIILADGNNGFKYYLESLDGYPLTNVYSSEKRDLISTIEQAKALSKQY
jgi:hypothetical protein